MFFGRMFPQIPFWSKIGKIPTSYRVAMSYEEQLLWLCKHVEDLDEEFKLALEQIIKDLNDYVEKLLKTIEVETDLTEYFVNGYAIEDGYQIGQEVDLTPEENASMCYAIIDVNEGELIRLTGTSPSPRLLLRCVLDEENKIIEMSEGAETAENAVFEMPENAKKFVINTELNSPKSLARISYKSIDGLEHQIAINSQNILNLDRQVSHLQDEIDDIQTTSVSQFEGNVELQNTGAIVIGGSPLTQTLETGFYRCNFPIYDDGMNNILYDTGNIVYYNELENKFYGYFQCVEYDSLNSEWIAIPNDYIEDTLSGDENKVPNSEAVQNAIDEVYRDFGSLPDRVDYLEHNVTFLKNGKALYNYDLIANAYIRTGVNIGSQVDLTPIPTTDNKYIILPVKEGDVFTISGKGGSQNRLVAFLDVSNNLINCSADGYEASNVQFTIPANCTTLVCNFDTPDTYTPSLVKTISTGGSSGSAINIVTEGTFDILNADDGIYALPSGCTITYGENGGNPVTYTTISQVIMSLVTYSNITYSEFIDVSSGEAVLITGTSNHIVFTGVVSSSLLTNTINYIRVNGNFVPVASGIADLTIPEITYGTNDLTPRSKYTCYRKCLLSI